MVAEARGHRFFARFFLPVTGERDQRDGIAEFRADRAREGVTLVELITYRRKGHAEHDNQSYVPAGEIERWERENDPITVPSRLATLYR